MTREEAIKTIRLTCPKISDSECDFETAMRFLVPELAESEDERIRAVILKLVLGMRDEIFTTADKLVTKPKVLAWLKKQKEVDWEEELEKCKRNYLYFFDKYVKIKLKPAEWSEEEYGRLFDIEHYLEGTLQLSPDRKIACIDFLKSLRPQWKPSEEQMEALENSTALTEEQGEALYSLIKDLKKL